MKDWLTAQAFTTLAAIGFERMGERKSLTKTVRLTRPIHSKLQRQERDEGRFH